MIIETTETITVSGKLADDLGALRLQACADVTRCIILPIGGHCGHGDKAYRPADAKRLSAAKAIESWMAEPILKRDEKARAFIAACYERRNEAPAAPEVCPLELGAALVRDALNLLDVVEHCDDGALSDGVLKVMTDDGRLYRIAVTVLEAR